MHPRRWGTITTMSSWRSSRRRSTSRRRDHHNLPISKPLPGRVLSLGGRGAEAVVNPPQPPAIRVSSTAVPEPLPHRRRIASGLSSPSEQIQTPPRSQLKLSGGVYGTSPVVARKRTQALDACFASPYRPHRESRPPLPSPGLLTPPRSA
jgi:hypothetical protein